ncbi:hypothetical protein HGM15179_001737 [Zosterops borbonicus]|uniref:Transmembrane protein 14C n=1 Tax=Zosterops borbonicus TaxID=364589 RepID=A0A8K1GXE2_9PASS|nr:hypothetical protein HGM15179_001737 [Zosterops borbonicus]
MEYDWLGFGYAALVAAGGVVGYAKAGSVPSLAAGLLFGGLAGLGAYQQSKDPKNVWLSLVASGTLTTVMGMRFYNSKKAMPGIIAGARYLSWPLRSKTESSVFEEQTYILPHIAYSNSVF